MTNARHPVPGEEKSGLSRRDFVQRAGSGLATVAVLTSLPGPLIRANSIDKTGIVSLTALELSQAIGTRALSCREVMSAYLAHIGKINPDFNAIVSLQDPESLMLQALQCDKELAKGTSRGWMHGFPIAIKDLADAKGLKTTRGSPIFRDNIAGGDSIHVARIKNAGAIIIGKTNVPEFGLGSHTYNPVFGATVNAYDGRSSAGGSSGGAAAALALQMLPVADGSDLMGSLRNPAAFNNVIGYRPTPGLVPLSDTFIEELPCNGPMGRNVQDTAMLLSTMAGYHPSSPTSLNLDPAQFSRSLAKDFKNVKIGWLGDFNGYLPMENGILSLCEKALQGFRDNGCIVDQVTPDYSMEQLWQTWLTFRHWLVRARALPLYQDPETRAQLKPELIWEIEGGENISGDQVAAASRPGDFGMAPYDKRLPNSISWSCRLHRCSLLMRRSTGRSKSPVVVWIRIIAGWKLLFPAHYPVVRLLMCLRDSVARVCRWDCKLSANATEISRPCKWPTLTNRRVAGTWTGILQSFLRY